MTNNRAPRSTTTRETEARRKPWTPPSHLAAPPPPEGYVHRWVRVAMRGEEDKMNVYAKLREGWEPVKAADHPELMLMGNDATGNVEIGGLMLCKMSQEMAEARDRYYNQQAQAQMDSVDNHFMRNSDPRMPLFSDRKSTNSRGGGFGSGSK